MGKGLPSLSGTFSQFSQPAANVESVDDLDFKDNSANSDHESEGTLNSVYQYAIPGESEWTYGESVHGIYMSWDI